jgi:hypothetical protein
MSKKTKEVRKTAKKSKEGVKKARKEDEKVDTSSMPPIALKGSAFVLLQVQSNRRNGCDVAIISHSENSGRRVWAEAIAAELRQWYDFRGVMSAIVSARFHFPPKPILEANSAAQPRASRG